MAKKWKVISKVKIVMEQKKAQGFKLDLNGKKVKLTQTNLAKVMGIPTQHLNPWVNARTLPSLPHALRLSYILGCTVNDLYEYKEVDVEDEEEMEEEMEEEDDSE